MKPQFILAREKKIPNDRFDSVIQMPIQDYLTSITPELILAQRERLEEDYRYRQLLPYLIISRQSEQGTEVLYYQRTPTSGEARLKGNHSIGLGGHIDIADVILNDDQSVNLAQTLSDSLVREIEEEVKSTSGHDLKELIAAHQSSEIDGLLPATCMVIRSDDTAVDQFHECIGLMIEVPAGVEIEENEDQIDVIGFKPASWILEHVENLESWSEKILRHLAK